MRTTVADVKAVLLEDYDSATEPSLTPFLETASTIVDAVYECATNLGFTLSTTQLELIERWLAAHCYAMSDQTYASKNNLRGSGSFHGQTGMRLEATKYGQMATVLDVSGCLSTMGQAPNTVRVGWGGKRKSLRTDYTHRD